MTETSAASRKDEQDEIIRRLEEDIIFGRFTPGARLIEDRLMARYGAPGNLCEALVQLGRQGIVLREKNVGATVRSVQPEEVRQIYDVREMLTRQAALIIALPAGASLIERIGRNPGGLRAPMPKRAGPAWHPRHK